MFMGIKAGFKDIPGTQGVATLRATGGYSRKKPYLDFNLSYDVGDSEKAVTKNRKLLLDSLPNASQISWINQIHSNKVVVIKDQADIDALQDADAQVTNLKGVALSILTADCIPILFYATDGSVVGAAHAGWRGLLSDIIANTIDTMNLPGKDIKVWLGPCIGPWSYEVEPDLKAKFIAKDETYEEFFHMEFRPYREYNDLYETDLHGIATRQLQDLGVDINNIKACPLSTYDEYTYFFSYRRDNKVTGRQASLVWIEDGTEPSLL